ncbi:MAG: hypothetical protein WCJ64_04095 [Rhodospirillaceae bacterium]
MSFPRYPEYKDSGVEWLGEVPGHWVVCALKRDLKFLTSGSRGWAEHYSDDGAAFIRIGNLTRESINLDLSDLQRVMVPEGVEGERTRVEPGDLLFSITAYLGSVAVVPEELETAYVSQHVALARLRRSLFLPAWVGYVTLSHVGKTYLETQGYGGTKIQLSLEDVASLIMTAPPLSEQAAIVAFIDRETGKIDALVAEQEKLIALLTEKRQAVISHAVTKGLNPAAPMKDSGIEWLGDVPEHWNILLLKRAFISIDYGISSSLSSEGRVAILRMGNINDGKVMVDDLKFVDDVDPFLLLTRGDLLYNRTNSLDLIGKVGLYVGDSEIPISFASYLVRLRTNPGSNQNYLSYLLNTSGVLGVARANAFVAIGQCNLNPTRYAEMRVALPPLPEQSAIVAYLDEQTAKLDALTAEAGRAIALLKEHRSALISAAVTGKIDVRGLVEKEVA